MMPSMSLRTARDDAPYLNDEVARQQAPLPPIAIIGISALPAGRFYQCYTKQLRCGRRFLAHSAVRCGAKECRRLGAQRTRLTTNLLRPHAGLQALQGS